MSLQLPYDSRRLFPFGLSPIPEVPSELASEVSSLASYSPTPSLDDSDTEVESVRSRGSIMYSGSCDSIKSNRTLHGKSSDSESSTETDHDTNEEDTEEECENYRPESIPPDTPGPEKSHQLSCPSVQNKPLEACLQQPQCILPQQGTLYNSEVIQVMHQRTFIGSAEQTQSQPAEGYGNEQKQPPSQFSIDTSSRVSGTDMVSGAATASEIFRHLQATRGKQEVTTELAKILNVLKTTLATACLTNNTF